MNENVKRQQRRFMTYNLIAFALIFALFGTVLYAQIRASLYNPLKESISIGREIILRVNLDELMRRFDDRDGLRRDDSGSKPDDKQGERPVLNSIALSMRFQPIVRDENGEIVNQDMLGRLYFEGYLDLIPFSTDQLDQTVTFKLDHSAYISHSFVKKEDNGKIYYVQILTNVDAEEAVLSNFLRLLTVGGVIVVLLSISASLLLTKKTMEPLIKSWNRQTEFVADASHELRTPLTIIQNKLESMLTRPLSTIMENSDGVGVSLAETRRLTKLTSDLMTLARADSSDTQLEKDKFSLDGLVGQVCEPYFELAEVQGKTTGIKLECNTEIMADKARIHQLMVILLDNALKYTAEGDSIHVSTYIKENRVMIEVTDTGIGIPEESRERVFERFYREDKARSRKTGGSGLGLSIARWIVDSHGGSISAQPTDGAGTRFTVKLKIL